MLNAMPIWRRVLTGIAAVMAAACASPAPSPVVARTAAVPAGPTLEDRLAKLERILASNNLAEVLQRLETVQRELGKLQGDFELQAHQLDGAQKRQRELYLDSDRRLQALETAINGMTLRLTALESQTAQISAAATAAANNAEALAASEEQDYQRALDAIKDGKGPEAVTLFQEYLKQHPSGLSRDNAYYWLGEAQLMQKNPKSALEAFSLLVAQFPNSDKLADAHLKIGYSHYDLKDWAKAKGALETVRKKFPDTSAARLAEKRLKQIKLEGH